jgi:subtilisin family serine protease
MIEHQCIARCTEVVRWTRGGQRAGTRLSDSGGRGYHTSQEWGPELASLERPFETIPPHLDGGNVKRITILAVGALALVACQDIQEPMGPTADPVVGPAMAAGTAIPGRFIVTLRDGASPSVVAAAHGVSPDYVYSAALNGFAGSMGAAARDGLLRDARVTRVEPDRVVQAFGTQNNATWGLDRIDARAGLDGTYTYNTTASGVTAYIIDTGIYTAHADFGGRASNEFDAFSDGQNGQDCNGHGTHVAGTIGGSTWGVAKGVTLVGVRVLNCSGSGTTAGVIAGVDWVTANAPAAAVANMSLGGGASSSLDAAVANSINSGIPYALAAGNGNMGGREQDACGSSPARVPEGMTIGATTQSDSKTSWSNYGDCVDWFAPGYQIKSSWLNDNYSGDGSYTRTISGTSMAAPHVAGVAALYVASHPGASAQEVRDALYSFTTKGIVTNSSTANNHLLYSFETVDAGGGGGDGGGETCTHPSGKCR